MLHVERRSELESKVKIGNFKKNRIPRKSEKIGDSRDLVTCQRLFPDKDMPLLIRPKQNNVNLAEWTRDNLDYLNELLFKSGAVLFRDFDLKTDEDFGNYMGALPFELIPYFEGSTPREEVAPRIYTSTMFPSEETIALHNEYSSSTKFPILQRRTDRARGNAHCQRPPDPGPHRPRGKGEVQAAGLDADPQLW